MAVEPKGVTDFRAVLPEKVAQQSIPEKIREGLTSHKWDALVVLGVENVHYCSGAYVPYARFYLDRQMIVVWPRDGEPTCIAGEPIAGKKAQAKFCTHFVGYDEKGALPPAVIVETLAEVLQREDLANGLIGLEMLRTSVLFWNRLRELLPGAAFEPADGMFRRLRMVKTLEEIESMSMGAWLTDEGVWKAFQSSKAGESESEVARKILVSVLDNGCSAVPMVFLGTGEGAQVIGSPSERKLKVGDLVRLDMYSIYRGYYVDLGRMAVVGEPSAEQIRAYRDQIELKRRILEFMQPGRTCSEVHALYLEQADRMNVDLRISPYLGLGHSIGVNPNEFPMLIAGEQTVLEPGMIFDVEPDTIGPNGEVMHTEDMVLVTSDGVEVLTQSEGHDWSELLVIPA